MSIFQALILGMVQGVAEFLPISSSGHLTLLQNLFSLENIPLLFDVMLHLATLAAVIIYFRKKIARLFKIFILWLARSKSVYSDTEQEQNPEDFLTGSEELGRKTILAVIFATIVTGAIGVFTSKVIPDLPIKFTCAGFLLTALLLIFCPIYEKIHSGKNEFQKKVGISIRQALFIGFMQGIGTLPGVSRSGSTIAGAEFVGVNRICAGEFSFIVSIPAILGAFILEAKDLGEIGTQIGLIPLLCGCISAFTFGYISLAFLMKIIRKGKLEWFACYLIPLGIFGLFYF